jgi:hypothetical protein
VQQSRFTLSETPPGGTVICEVTLARLTTITNTSSLPLTWRPTIVTPGVFSVVVTPPGSTLAPGEAVAALVSVRPPQVSGSLPSDRVIIDIGADDSPSQRIQLYVSMQGQYDLNEYPDLDFGNVALGARSDLTINRNPRVLQSHLGFDQLQNPEFTWNYSATGGAWILSFQPRSVGAKEVTVEIIALPQLCPSPITFKMRGVGVIP